SKQRGVEASTSVSPPPPPSSSSSSPVASGATSGGREETPRRANSSRSAAAIAPTLSRRAPLAGAYVTTSEGTAGAARLRNGDCGCDETDEGSSLSKSSSSS